MLLDRSGRTVPDALEFLVGLQAQNPHDPYYALWSRLERFDPEGLSRMIERREALRGALMRATLHVSTTPDFIFLRSHLQSTMAAVLGSTSFAKDMRDLDRQALLDHGRQLLEEQPMTRADLAKRLEERWPGVPGSSMAQVVTYLLPVIQVPPRGLWGQTGPARWTTLDSWAGGASSAQDDVQQIVLRYLAAFGPASISDMRVWSRLNGLRPVVEGMRDRLQVLHDEDGAELLDVVGAPVFDEATPAPPRFLPEYDNVLLGHSDRSRFFEPGIIPPGWAGNLLVDGIYSGWWKIIKSDKARQIEIHLQRRVSRAETKEVGDEADRLLDFAHPESATAGGVPPR